MSSSDDDLPLVQRAGKISAAINLDSDDDSLPSWLVDHKSPVPAGLPASTDSSDIEEVTAPTREAPVVDQPLDKSAQKAGKKQLPKQGPPVNQREPQEDKLQTQETAAASTPIASRAKGKGSDAEPVPPLSQPSSQPAATALKKAAAGTVAAPSNELSLVLPEKLPQNKLLVELESVEGGATDLAGDAGAVGRMIVRGASGDQELQIDLKGVLYSASIIPSAVTMAVVNIGQAEAKVECLFTEFLQLREDTRFSCHDTGTWDALMGDDQEDHYVMGDHAGGEDGSAAPGGGGKKGRLGGGQKKVAEVSGKGGGAKSGRGGGSAAKGLKPKGGGVKKPRAKPSAAGSKGAKPKPKPKPRAKAKAGAPAKKK